MPPENESAWERLGRLLGDRRTEIAARYKNKNLFAEEREINRRMLWSVETGARGNYGKETLRAVERAYMLVPGSVERTVAGGDLEPLGAPAPMRTIPVPPPAAAASEAGEILADLLSRHPDDEVIQTIGAQAHMPSYERTGKVLRWLERQGDSATAVEVRAGLVARYPDDEVLQTISRQSGKRASMVAEEILDWLCSQGPAVPQARNGTVG